MGYYLYLSEKIHVFKKEIKGKWPRRRTYTLSGKFYIDGDLGQKLSAGDNAR